VQKTRIPLSCLKTTELANVVTVTHFCDYTQKYGVGYRLSTNQFGVLFNDSTKIVTLPTPSDPYYFLYVEKTTKQVFSLQSHPHQLKKKVLLMEHFRLLIEGKSHYTQ
jgi:polo-like kinase 1